MTRMSYERHQLSDLNVRVFELAQHRVGGLPPMYQYDPKNPKPLRCHELARAVALMLKDECNIVALVQDGHFGRTEHSWLWMPYELPDLLPGKEPCLAEAHLDEHWLQVFKLQKPRLLDVYCVATLPMVQIRNPLHFTFKTAYTWDRVGISRTDINHVQVQELREHLTRR